MNSEKKNENKEKNSVLHRFAGNKLIEAADDDDDDRRERQLIDAFFSVQLH